MAIARETISEARQRQLKMFFEEMRPVPVSTLQFREHVEH